MRHLDQVDVVLLRGTELAQSPLLFPRRRVGGGFVVTGARSLEKKVSVLGGPAVTIAELPDNTPRGVSWGSDDTIVFATADSKAETRAGGWWNAGSTDRRGATG